LVGILPVDEAIELSKAIEEEFFRDEELSSQTASAPQQTTAALRIVSS
jgi:hypothetical protein